MTNPTSNYAFQMPTATDLVTDLPADFEVFGQAVDTRLKALQPGTTLGDVAYSSATANTNTRLGIGSTGDVLTVAGGVPAWSAPLGGITLLSTTTLSGASTTISSISTSYNYLHIVISGVTAAAAGLLRIAPNANTAVTNNFVRASDTTVGQMVSDYLMPLSSGNGSAVNQILGTGGLNAIELQIYNYASATAYKPYFAAGTFVNGSSLQGAGFSMGGIRLTTAITSLVFTHMGGNFSGGTVLIYGVK